MHMMFNFQVNQSLFYALASADMKPLVKALNATRPDYATAQWGLFLRNHDELDLGRLTKAQREEVFAAFGRTSRCSSMTRHPPPAGADAEGRSPDDDGARLQPHAVAARHAGAALWRRDRHGRRSQPARTLLRPHAHAMVEREQGGFSSAEKTYLPVISEGAYGWEQVNVADQRRDPHSFLNWMERMIRTRQETQEIGWGAFEVVDVGHDAVLCLRYEWRNNVAVFLHNFHPEGVSVRFTLAAPEGEPNRLVNLLSEDHSQGDAKGRYELTLEPYGYRWFRMGGLDYAYRRTEL